MNARKFASVLLAAFAVVAINASAHAQDAETDEPIDMTLASPVVVQDASNLPYKVFAPVMRRATPSLDDVKSCLRGVAPNGDVTLCGPVHKLRDAWIATYQTTPQIKTFTRAGGTFTGFYLWIDPAYGLENECQIGYALTGYVTPDTIDFPEPNIQPGQWFTKCNTRVDGNYYNQLPLFDRYPARFEDDGGELIQVFFENLNLTLFEDGSFAPY